MIELTGYINVFLLLGNFVGTQDSVLHLCYIHDPHPLFIQIFCSVGQF